MRFILVASVVVLLVGCGRENLTAPTRPVAPVVQIAPAPAPASGSLRPGNFEVVFAVDPACTDLPSLIRTRTYSGSFDGFFLRLSGSEFGATVESTWDVMYVKVSEDSASVYFSDPPIWERPTTDSDLFIEGNAKGTAGSDTTKLSFRGSFSYCPKADRGESRYSKCEVSPISCRSVNHQLTLSPK
jgi:hypothetical protein